MYEDDKDRMIKSQAELISKHNEEMFRMQKDYIHMKAAFRQYAETGRFYVAMYNTIIENEMLQELWTDFILQLRLINPNLEQDIKDIQLPNV